MPTERLLNVDVHKQRATRLAFRWENSVITMSSRTGTEKGTFFVGADTSSVTHTTVCYEPGMFICLREFSAGRTHVQHSSGSLSPRCTVVQFSQFND